MSDYPKINGLCRPYRLCFPVDLGTRRLWELAEFIIDAKPEAGLCNIEAYDTAPGEVMIPRMRHEGNVVWLTMILEQDETVEAAYDRTCDAFAAGGWATERSTK